MEDKEEYIYAGVPTFMGGKLISQNEIKNYDDNNIYEVAKKFSRGMLMGARGNSGVILSQFFRGIYKGLADKTEVNAVVSAKGVSIEIVDEMRINEIVFINEEGKVIAATFTQGGVKMVGLNSVELYDKAGLEGLKEGAWAYNENPSFNVIDEQSKFPVEKIQTKK